MFIRGELYLLGGSATLPPLWSLDPTPNCCLNTSSEHLFLFPWTPFPHSLNSFSSLFEHLQSFENIFLFLCTPFPHSLNTPLSRCSKLAQVLLLLPPCWEGLCLHNELRILCNEVDTVYKEVREICKCAKFYTQKKGVQGVKGGAPEPGGRWPGWSRCGWRPANDRQRYVAHLLEEW